MTKPYKPYHPYEPHKNLYLNRTELKTIYSFYQSLRPCDYCDNESCHNECEKAIEYLGEKDTSNTIPLEEMTLQKLLDILPEGIKPCDVKISIDVDVSDMAYEGHSVDFYYEKPLPDRTEEWEKVKADYDAAYSKYQKELEKYNEWFKQKEIKELEEKLNQLKGK